MALVTTRYLRRFVRMPQVLFLGTAQPIVFVLMLNAVFGGLVAGAQGGSLRPVPGARGARDERPPRRRRHRVRASAEDVRDGMIDRFRSLPMSRAAVLVGRTVTDVVRYASKAMSFG